MQAPRRRPPPEDEAATFRLGGAAAGLVGGLVFGLMVGGAAATLGAGYLAPFIVFGCAALGAIAGYIGTAAGLALFEAALHTGIGFISGIAQTLPKSSELAPKWLRFAPVAGVLLGLAFLVIRTW